MNERDDFEDRVDQPRPGGAKESAPNDHDDSENSIESQSSGSADRPQEVPADDGAREASLEFPVVGVGASAGGLEAAEQLLRHLPADVGLAVVLVQHLSPHHPSNLAEILSRATEMPVREAADGMPLQPNHVYVIPPQCDLAVLRGALHLMTRPHAPARHMPIDYLFRSLAEDLGRRAIGVVLSGTGSDGAEGVRAIKAEGGITLAQDEQSARFDAMPRAAVTTGQVDLVLPPAGIAKELARIARHPHLRPPDRPREQPSAVGGADTLQKIFFLLRRATGVDFSQYKQTTLERRIARRMVVHKIDTVERYLQYLQRRPAEVHALFADMLITLTSFFREPETFDLLKKHVFPQITRDQDSKTPIRIWVAGCSTGEEAYSLAISLLEYLQEKRLPLRIQIFGSDISDAAIQKARHGLYPENIAGDVSEERLRRHFVRTGGGYQISKHLRDFCVFARQNVLRDPPFSRIDLLSCRNLLIYLGSAAQKRVMPIFHYALKPRGYLLLGRSETIGGFGDLFSLVDREQKIYIKKASATRLPPDLDVYDTSALVSEVEASSAVAREPPGLDLEREADRIVLSEFGPPGVIVNPDLEILHFRGQTNAYLAPAPGAASFNLMKMVRPELRLDVRAMIHQAKREHQPVRKEGLNIADEEGKLLVDVEVHPLGRNGGDDLHFLVLFQPTETPAEGSERRMRNDTASGGEPDEKDREIRRLQEELRQTMGTLKELVEDQDATNEELRAANEEIQSANEELQSTNEELETAKEELQSSNEELITLNMELEHQIAEATQAIDDFNNLHRSVGISVILLDSELRIRRFTPPAEKTLKLQGADVGRPIGELRLGIRADTLEQEIREVLSTLNSLSKDVQCDDGRWYSLQIRPYRAADDRITGTVLMLLDITEQRRSEAARMLAQVMAETVRQPMAVLDTDLRFVTANRAFYQTFPLAREDVENRRLLDVVPWKTPELRRMLQHVLAEDDRYENFEIVHDFPNIGKRKIMLDARRIDGQGDLPGLILLAFSMQPIRDGGMDPADSSAPGDAGNE